MLQNIQTIIAVGAVVILDLAAIAKGIATIVAKISEVTELTAEEQAAAKANVTENLRQIIFGLVTDAEKDLGGGTGKLKSSKVAGWIYDKIPDELKAMYTAEEIQEMIDGVLVEAKEYWNANSAAREYIENTAIVVSPVIEATAGPTESPQDGQNAADDKEPATT